ncbi:MAG: hypothetical protein PVF54_07605 [Anaerolineae bacterium]
MRSRKRTVLLCAGALLAYAVLTVVMTWPVVSRLGTHLVGDGDDMWVHYWNGWWVKQVLDQGGSPYYTDLLFHPTGVSLLYHNFGWVNITLWLVLESLVGGVVGYNLVYLIHIPLCGLAMFALVRKLTRSQTAAFLAGLVFAFWPYRMLDANHPNMICTEGFPLLMLALLRLFRGEKPLWSGALGGTVLALIGYMRWQLVILAGLMMAAYLLYTVAWERERWTRRTAAGLALMVALASALVAPAVRPLVRDQLTHGLDEDLSVVDAGSRKQDVLAWVLPQPQHVLSGVYNDIFPDYGYSRERSRFSAFLGHVAIALVTIGVAAQRKKKETWFWASLAILCLVFAWGPHLRFNTVLHTGVPLPYRLIGWLLPIKLLRNPHRFTALLAVPVAVLAGYGALTLKTWSTRRRWRRYGVLALAWPVLIAFLILLDYWSVPMVTVSADVPDFYQAVAEDPDGFAIMGVPGSRGHTEYYMFYQTVHERPILGGHVSRLPPEALEFSSSIPLTAGIYKETPERSCPPDVSRQLSLLSDAGFRYIVLHKEIASERKLAPWRSCLVVSPRFEDTEVVVYSTAPVAGRDFTLAHDFEGGIGLIDATVSQKRVAPDAVLDLNVIWGTETDVDEDLQVEIALMDDNGIGQRERFEISPDWPTGEWSANAIVRDSYALQVDPWLRAGNQTVAVGLAGSDGNQPAKHEEVGRVRMEAPERVFGVPPMEHTGGAVFGDALRLLGYDLNVAGEEVRVVLHWQALRRMDESYKFFVHLEDPRSNELVAQRDVVPREWSHPTTWWEAQEIVSDELALPSRDIAPGEYQLWVGVYRRDTGRRLSVSDASPELDVARDRLLLSEFAVR